MSLNLKLIAPAKAVFRCWYSPSVYREAAFFWRGLGFKYLTILLVSLWFVVALNVQRLVHDYAKSYLRPILLSMPKAQIQDGVLTVDRKDKRFTVFHPLKKDQALIEFDLTDNPRAFDPSEDGVFVETRRVIFHYQGKEEIYDFARISKESYNWPELTKYLHAVESWSGAVVLGVFWLSSFIFMALQVLAWGLLGKAIAALNNCRLTYAQLVRIAVVAVTPSLIIDTVQKLALFGIPAWTLVSSATTAFYLYFGIRANSIAHTYAMLGTMTGRQLAEEAKPTELI